MFIENFLNENNDLVIDIANLEAYNNYKKVR